MQFFLGFQQYNHRHLFQVIGHFSAQKNQILEEVQEIFREVWDMDSVGDIATVTVHIKKIREKIEYNTAKPQYIETIWGVGYRFKM